MVQTMRECVVPSMASTCVAGSPTRCLVTSTSPPSPAVYSTNESARPSRSTWRRSNGIVWRSVPATPATTSRRLGASATRRATDVSTSTGSAWIICWISSVTGYWISLEASARAASEIKTHQYNPTDMPAPTPERVTIVNASQGYEVVNTLSEGLSWVDLQFHGRPQVIATGLVQGRGGVAIVDPGPTTCLPTLELGLQASGIRWPDVRQILLTHIHLDHAGA